MCALTLCVADVADGMNNAQYKQDGRVPPQQPLPLHPLEGTSGTNE